MSVGSWTAASRYLAVACLVVWPAWAGAVGGALYAQRLTHFEARALPYEERIDRTDGGLASIEAGQAYAEFLDTELNLAYRALLATLQGPERAALIAAQRQWLRFRDAELAFARLNWTRARSGSSYTLSRAQHRTQMLKSRVVTLLAAREE